MKLINTILSAVICFLLLFGVENAVAQCSVSSGPYYGVSTSGNYLTSITASGTGSTTSTISYTGCCSGSTYLSYYSSQGIVAPAGATITMPISRVYTHYNGTIAVYVDWNNNGTFETTELVAPSIYFAAYSYGTFYNCVFNVPTSGVVTGANLHMRVWLGEQYSSYGFSPPCSAAYGQAIDYYFVVNCPLTTPVTTTPPSGSICSGDATGVTFTATGAGTGGTYTWSPSATLSASSGATVTAHPTATTIYTITATDVTGCTSFGTTTVTVNPLPVVGITPASPSICAGSSVTLSTPTGAGYTYQWSVGGVPIPGATDATYSAGPSTTSNYSVQTTTAAGCSASSATSTVFVNPLPVASVTPTGPLGICVGNSATLTAGSGTGYTYQWYNTPTLMPGETNATLNVSAAGDYYVVVTGPGSCVSASNAVNVTMNSLPTANISASGSLSFCSGDSVVFTASSGAGYTYQWSNATGSIPGATNITYSALTPGTYHVQVTNGAGCSNTSASLAVVVNPLPVTTITHSGGTSVCFPNGVLLNATIAAGYTYQWYKNGTLIPGATNASYNANTTGNYSVEILNTLTGCTAITTGPSIVSVTIRPKPTASFTYSPSITRFCSYDSVTLTSLPSAGYTYEWTFNNLPIVGATNLTYHVHTSGNYKLVVFNGGCSDTTSPAYTDTVDQAPSSSVTTSGAVSFCAGGSVTISAIPGAGYTYQWYSSPTPGTGTPISGATNINYVASNTGYYHSVITSPQGCITSSAGIFVTSVPPPVIVPGGPTTFCEGINVALSVTPVPGAVYQWKKNSINIPGAVSSSYVATSTGDYTCYVNLSGVCASTSSLVHVLVHPLPIPVVSFDGVRVSTYTYYTSYQWYINTVTIPGATTYSTPAYTNASYRVLVTDTFGCARLSDPKNVYNVGIEDVNVASSISMYPNPASQMVHIEMPQGMEASICTVEGKTFIEARSEKDIDIHNLPAGLYMVIVTDKEGRRVYTGKLVKQ